jgi:hypothetical protein
MDGWRAAINAKAKETLCRSDLKPAKIFANLLQAPLLGRFYFNEDDEIHKQHKVNTD